MAGDPGDITLDPRWPADVQVSDASLRRWQYCAGIAAAITRQPVESPECALFARVLYNDPELPTDDQDVEEAYVESEHPRGRGGEWIGKGRYIKIRGLGGAGPMSPGIKSMRRRIHDLGFDKDPVPGPVARRILGDHLDTRSLHLARRDRTPLDSPAYEPYTKKRRQRHDKIIGRALAGIPDTPGKPHTGVAALLGPDDGIVRKLLKGARLSQAEKERVRDAAARHRGDRKPLAMFAAGGTASGKSTLLENNPNLMPAHALRIDPDALKEQLPEYQRMIAAREPYAAFAAHEESSDLAARLDQEATDLGLDLVVDGTGNSEPGRFARKLTRQHDAGYDVGAVYVDSPTEDAIDQAVTRAELTRRWVPVRKAREIHRNVSREFNHNVSKLPWLKSLDVFDSRAGHIATQVDGDLVAFDPDRLAAFRAKEFEGDE